MDPGPRLWSNTRNDTLVLGSVHASDTECGCLWLNNIGKYFKIHIQIAKIDDFYRMCKHILTKSFYFKVARLEPLICIRVR